MTGEDTESNAIGRPTTYSPELCEKAREYLDDYKTEHKHEFPSVVGLCRVLDRSRATLYRWADPKSDCFHPEFKDILATVAEVQELVLLNNGVTGTFNAQITKLVLGKHGYHDKHDTTASFSVSIGEKDAETL